MAPKAKSKPKKKEPWRMRCGDCLTLITGYDLGSLWYKHKQVQCKYGTKYRVWTHEGLRFPEVKEPVECPISQPTNKIHY